MNKITKSTKSKR